MPNVLSKVHVDIVEATAPAVAANIDSIVPAMYRHLLADPKIRVLFNMTHQDGGSPQHKALANALVAYATHIRNPQMLGAGIERIAQKHAGLQILPEHYPYVAEALLTAVKEVLGDAATEEVLEAWGAAYWYLANILIDREEEIYSGAEAEDGGWRGWRDFAIVDKQAEADDIMSFTLRPADGAAVKMHRPGQYLSFRIVLPDGEELRRNYSISSAPNGRDYRITVKREAQGKASGWLHDTTQIGTTLQVAPPAGDFFLDLAGKQQVVLLSGGVGLTPMISMLESRRGSKSPQMLYVHATQNGRKHAMRSEHEKLADKSFIFYEAPGADDVEGRDYTGPGRIDPAWLAKNTRADIADYYICGPEAFMRQMINGLKAANVSPDRIHYEFFGPAAAELK